MYNFINKKRIKSNRNRERRQEYMYMFDICFKYYNYPYTSE